MNNNDNRKKYEIKCPYCGKNLWACKSMGMEIGWVNYGVAKCLDCSKQFQLEYNFDADTMKAIKFITPSGVDVNETMTREGVDNA